MQFGIWDLLLLLVVTTHATLIAYVHNPRRKVLFLLVPSTMPLGILALGRPVDATNILGLLNLVLFAHAVRWLHQKWRVPIVSAISAASLLYLSLGVLGVQLLPTGSAVFWIACIVALGLAVILHYALPPCAEPGHRTALPVWIKIPIIAVVVFTLIAAKNALAGFMTTFPMVGVLAFYEGRHCLWTMAGRVSDSIVVLLAMLLICRMTQNYLGLGGALVLGFFVITPALVFEFRRIFHQTKEVIPYGGTMHGRTEEV